MKKLLALKLVFLLLCTTLAPLGQTFAKTGNCENGECIEKLIDRLEELEKLYKAQCLPKNIKHADIPKYQIKNGITEECFQILNEVKQKEDDLSKHKDRLEGRLGCESGDCKMPNTSVSINSQLNDLSKVSASQACNETKKQEIKNSCSSELTCVMTASALGVGGYLAEILVPEKAKPKNCHLGNDSCVTQLASSFIKAAVSFFEGLWWMVSSAGKYAGKKMGEFWNWVSGAEDHSSTSQLALAQASKDPSIFKELTEDFPGAMKKIFSAFVASLKEWMKTDVFCQKWAGVPRASKCLVPTSNFDCLSCKTAVTGLCSISGTLIAEIVPAFLSGGISVALKQGVNGAAKLATLFKVSEKGLAAVKSTKIGRAAVSASAKTDEVLRVTKGLKAAKDSITIALRAIRAYMLSPSRKALKVSYTSLMDGLKKGGAAIAEAPGGKILVFSGTVLKYGAKTVLYPIDNPMTNIAYRAGHKTFDKIFTLGRPTLAVKTSVATAILQKDPSIETTLAKIAKETNESKRLILEKELLTKVEPIRKDATKIALSKDNTEFSQLVKDLYPELQYGQLAKKLPAKQVAAVEKELYIEISQMADGARKLKLMKQYNSYVSGNQLRAKILKNHASLFDTDIKPIPKPVPQNTGEFKLVKRPVRPSAEGNIIFQDGNAADIHTKNELSAVMRTLKSKPNSSIYINITPDSHKNYVFRVTGLDQKSSDTIIEAMLKNEKLTHGFNEQFRLGRNQLNIEVLTRESGQMKVEDLRFRADTVVLEEVIEQPTNYSRGMFKIMSPTLHGADHQATQEKKQ
ncbi:hypothetical protein ACJVC5_05405 [Peredibacter sp. HCB2-198]|uniref:hypothetical protein n=1 Tax=Peredibacter sp. HCB2-198 TaxID=3383025 RepID=UPI0038B642F3